MRRHDQNFTKKPDIAHSVDAITTYNDLRARNFLTNKQCIMASNLVNYKIARYYFKENEDEKALTHLNAIFKHSSLIDKLYLKSKILKFIPYFRN